MKVEIFTDGTHFKKQGRLGCGGVLIVDGKKVDEFSLELTPDYLKSTIHTSDVSNPTTEMMGVYQAIKRFKFPSGSSEITIYTDYEGVGKWMTEKWKINKPYIKLLHDMILGEMKKKKIDKIATFSWVPAHQPKSVMDPKARWNNYVDSLAKGEV